MNRIDKLIHEELLPIRQMFISYTQLSHNPSIHINPKVFTKCAVKIEEVILIAREMAGKGEENGEHNEVSGNSVAGIRGVGNNRKVNTNPKGR